MGIKVYKARTPGRRNMTGFDFKEITTDSPEKSLTEPIKRQGGRNNRGRITMRYQGGGHKRRYRVIDFKRNKDGIEGTVASIEYDPNRTCRIALINYTDGEKAYILAPVGLGVNDKVIASETADIKAGNCLTLNAIPTGTTIS